MHTWQLEEACGHIMCTLPAAFAVYPELLEKSGYFTGYTGKGWAPGYWQEYGRTQNPAGPSYNDRKLEVPAKTNVSQTDYTANFKAFLDEKPGDEPFCFWYGGFEPHRHYVPGEGLRAGKKLSDVRNLPSYWPDDDVVKSDILDYAFEIEWFDTHLGNMLDLLRERNELDNTIIVATSDNGCPFPRVKGQMYENDFHLPLAICWPCLQNGNRHVDDLVSFTDFAPTFLEAAGIDAHPQMAGRSLLPQITADHSGLIEEDRTEVYMGRECHDPGREGDKGYPVRCIREQEYLYVWNFKPERWPAGNPETLFTNCDGSPTKDLILELKERGNDYFYNLSFGKRPAEELYNIEKDPECMHNLAGDTEFAVQKERMRQKLKQKLIETKDPRINGKGEVFEGYVSKMLNDPKVIGSYFWNYYKNTSWQAYLDNTWKLPEHMDWKRFKIDKG
jgi:arylsulfatase A-like enzyme